MVLLNKTFKHLHFRKILFKICIFSVNIFQNYKNVNFTPPAAPKIIFDGLNLNVNANVGEPFKIKVPFKGGPLPAVQFFNVSTDLFIFIYTNFINLIFLNYLYVF